MGLKIHWRAPLQPKGFLKIVEFFLAIIAFSLVAGFSISPSLDFACLPDIANNYSLKISYPFRDVEQTTTNDLNDVVTKSTKPISDKGIARSAEYFVAWGVLTMFYCIIALVVYMLVTANEGLEKVFDFLVITDIVFHIVWILCWFIASVDWAVAFNRLKSVIDSYFNDLENGDCGDDVDVLDEDRDLDIYVQAAFAVVFGFLIQFVWAVNIGWLVIDTSWYINWKAINRTSRRQGYAPL